MFDEQPDGDPHGECALEIKTLQARIAELEAQVDALRAERDALKVERDEWAEKWHQMRRQYGEMRWPGMTRVVTASDAAMNQPKEGQ